jgi:hypothetical protein
VLIVLQASPKDGGLDPSRQDYQISHYWLRPVTSFKRDRNVYAWEPHKRLPALVYISFSPFRSCRLQEAAAHVGDLDAWFSSRDLGCTRGSRLGEDRFSWTRQLYSSQPVVSLLALWLTYAMIFRVWLLHGYPPMDGNFDQERPAFFRLKYDQ